MRHGCPLPNPLPKGLSSAERSAIPALIQPQWVNERSLLNIENIDLGEGAILRILDMLLRGIVKTPATRPSSGPVAAALDLLQPGQPSCAEELASLLVCLYEQSDRFLKLSPQAWLSRLDKLAGIKLEKLPEVLNRLLAKHMDAQWIVVDCLAIVLANTVQEILPRCFPRWKPDRMKFAMVSEQTSTEAIYLGLIGGDLTRPFLKIDVVDALIHERKLSFKELLKLVQTELEMAFRKTVERLDPERPLLIYGDHGFRLAPDGIGYTHGGASTVERLTAVFILIPD